MTFFKSTLIALALGTVSATSVLAHETRSLTQTQAAQLREIELQRQRGQLTAREYNRLVAEQGRIAELENRALADGHVNGREYRAISEAQREAGQHIYQESHDRQVNYWRAWKWGHGWRN